MLPSVTNPASAESCRVPGRSHFLPIHVPTGTATCDLGSKCWRFQLIFWTTKFVLVVFCFWRNSCRLSVCQLLSWKYDVKFKQVKNHMPNSGSAYHKTNFRKKKLNCSLMLNVLRLASYWFAFCCKRRRRQISPSPIILTCREQRVENLLNKSLPAIWQVTSAYIQRCRRLTADQTGQPRSVTDCSVSIVRNQTHYLAELQFQVSMHNLQNLIGVVGSLLENNLRKKIIHYKNTKVTNRQASQTSHQIWYP